jgi:hypothetical protein
MRLYHHIPKLDILPLEEFAGKGDSIPLNSKEMPCCSGMHMRGYAPEYVRKTERKSAIYERKALELRAKALRGLR